MEEILLQARVKNNPLYQAIFSHKYYGSKSYSVKNFCDKFLPCDYQLILRLINFRVKPYSYVKIEDGNVKSVKWIPVAYRLSDVLKKKPDDLFNPILYESIIEPVIQKEIALEDVGVYLRHEEARLLKEHNVEEDAQKEEDARTLRKMLQYLGPREKSLVSMRFGLGEYSHPHTLEEVGRAFNISRERVRQMEQKVLQKLKEHPTSKHFNQILNG